MITASTTGVKVLFSGTGQSEDAIYYATGLTALTLPNGVTLMAPRLPV